MMGIRGSLEESTKRFGLTEVHTPTAGEHVDVVFIHGLDGYPYPTWTSEKDKIFWPAQLLPAVIEEEKARIMVYGYDADIASFTGTVSKDKIHNHADNLVAANGRQQSVLSFLLPISLGGLLVKRALIYSSEIRGHYTQHLLLSSISQNEHGAEKTLGRNTLASTGVLWAECDKMVALGSGGVTKVAAQRVEEYHGLLKDAIAELEEWDPDEDSESDTDSNAPDGPPTNCQLIVLDQSKLIVHGPVQ